MKLLDKLDDFVLRQYTKVSNEMYTRFGKDKYDLAGASVKGVSAGFAAGAVTFAGLQALKGDFGLFDGVATGLLGLMSYLTKKAGKRKINRVKEREAISDLKQTGDLTDLACLPFAGALFAVAAYTAISGSPEVAKEFPENLQSAGNALYTLNFASLGSVLAGFSSTDYFLRTKKPEEEPQVRELEVVE